MSQSAVRQNSLVDPLRLLRGTPGFLGTQFEKHWDSWIVACCQAIILYHWLKALLPSLQFVGNITNQQPCQFLLLYSVLQGLLLNWSPRQVVHQTARQTAPTTILSTSFRSCMLTWQCLLFHVVATATTVSVKFMMGSAFLFLVGLHSSLSFSCQVISTDEILLSFLWELSYLFAISLSNANLSLAVIEPCCGMPMLM